MAMRDEQERCERRLIDPEAALAEGAARGAGTFIAIDFETATRSRDSACALGAVQVENGKILETHRWLIKPPGNEYEGINIGVHGIRPAMTEGSPPFGEVWQALMDRVGSVPLVAHNASFEASVIRAGLAALGLPLPELTLVCTLTLARHCWPDWSSHALQDLAPRFGVEFHHHDAAEDARAAALLGVALCGAMGTSSILDAAAALGVQPEWLHVKRRAPSIGARSHRTDYKRLAPTREPPKEGPLLGKTVVFTGALQSSSRAEAAQHVVDAGGHVTGTVSAEVDYLVCGVRDARRAKQGPVSSKLRKILALQAQGVKIEIISEEDLIVLLGPS